MKRDHTLEKAPYWACWLVMAGLAVYLMVTYL
jgi:hypothetical protein